MSSEPTYPKDAPVGAPKEDVAVPFEKAPEPRRKRDMATGAAIGIGSAAIVAALLYANRSRRDKGPGGTG